MISRKVKMFLKEMNGQEVRSMHYENVVGIKGNKVIDAGKIVDILNTDKKVMNLWNEYYEGEGLPSISSLKKEFGF